MLFGFWSWVPVVLIVLAIFYANKLPELRRQAEEKLKEGKVILEKSKKELEVKAAVMAEKAKEKQKKVKQKASEAKKEDNFGLEEEEEITVEDLSFMPTDEKKDKQ